jgi:hypothetical protein
MFFFKARRYYHDGFAILYRQIARVHRRSFPFSLDTVAKVSPDASGRLEGLGGSIKEEDFVSSTEKRLLCFALLGLAACDKNTELLSLVNELLSSMHPRVLSNSEPDRMCCQARRHG